MPKCVCNTTVIIGWNVALLVQQRSQNMSLYFLQWEHILFLNTFIFSKIYICKIKIPLFNHRGVQKHILWCVE